MMNDKSGAPPSGDPGYPYEKLTTQEVARIQRLRDEQMTQLREENELLEAQLYYANQRLDRLHRLLKEMDIDEGVVLATAALLKGPDHDIRKR